jgi:uncharacterized alkaline shock family protein YloU
LIKGNKILAGSSAKREPTKVAAIRRAIFIDPNHSKDVRDVLNQLPDQRILILGTSDNMVVRIAEQLQLPGPSQIIRIEEIASPREIEKAQEKRYKEGKHVIPVPTIEVKPRFPGYLMESLDVFLGKKGKQTRAEKTIIRPRFSYYGKLLIHDNVIDQLAAHAARSHAEITRVSHIDTEKPEEGIRISVSVECIYGRNLPAIGVEVQKLVKTSVESCTGLNVLEVNILFTQMRVSK